MKMQKCSFSACPTELKGYCLVGCDVLLPSISFITHFSLEYHDCTELGTWFPKDQIFFGVKVGFKL